MPLLEVRRCADGHPPFTGREREIRLNGTSGVKPLNRPGLSDRSRPFRFYATAFEEHHWFAIIAAAQCRNSLSKPTAAR